MIYLSIVTKPDSAILEKDIIESEDKIKYTLKIVRKKPGSKYNSIEEEIKALIDEQIGAEPYTVAGKKINYDKYQKRGQFKIIHLIYEPAIPKVMKPKSEDFMVSELKHVVITNAILFVMNNDGKTIDSVNCVE